VDAAVAAGLTFLMLGPALLPGYVLRGDMVFVPHQPWKGAWLGLDGAYPRSVPMDAIVSASAVLIPGWVLQKLFLVGSLVGGGVGAGRLVAGWPAYARAGAVVLFVWNPYVLERLLIGQWALLLGYALLPWVALAAARCAEDLRAGWPRLGLALTAAAVASPSSGLMAAVVAVVVAALARSRRATAVAGGLAVFVNLCWIMPALFADTLTPTEGANPFDVFAARAESPLGVGASLLSLGGIWKTSVVPQERTETWVVALTVLLSVAACTALVLSPRDHGRRAVPGVAVVAGLSLAAALAATFAPVADVMADVSQHVPGLAILRDSHRYVAPLVLVLLPGMAALLTTLVARARPGREALRLVAGMIVLTPVLLLPSAAWGALGELRAVDYPAEWSTVAAIIEAEPEATTVVLPWTGSYRGFPWNDGRAVLDPAPRFLPGDVLVDDRVLLGDEVLPGESPAGAAVTRALGDTDPGGALRALGVRWVLVEKGHRIGPVPEGAVRHDGPGLRLLDLGTSVPSNQGTKVTTWLIGVSDLLIVCFVIVSVFKLVTRPDTMTLEKGGRS
jgi:hypothetical protein